MVRKKKFETKDDFDRYFEEHIRQHCKNDAMLKREELVELGFSTWIVQLVSSGRSGYSGLKEFSEKNGLIAIRSGVTTSKEVFDTFFQENILPHCKGRVMPKYANLLKLGFSGWANALKCHYDGIYDFAEKNGLQTNRRNNSRFSTKEKFDQYFKDHIRALCKDDILPTQRELIKHGHVSWWSTMYKRSYYSSFPDFADKHGLKVKENIRGRGRKKI